MNRQDLITRAAVAAGAALSPFPAGWAGAAEGPRRSILMFTKSSGFEHPAIKRKGSELGLAEQLLTDWGKQHGFDVTCTKDGGVFNPADIAKHDAFFFYTSGDLTEAGTDKNPPMSIAGKAAFLDAVKNGKGFIGCHSATDTFHSTPHADRNARYQTFGPGKVDPYVAMIGGEFIKHDAQQKARMRCVDNQFPGFQSLGAGFELMEEWYSLKEFSPDLHVLLVQETEGMEGPSYQRKPFPATWARRHGRGRVFYTSMGHRDDVWTNPMYQGMLLGGIAWAVGNVQADVTPNLERAAPGHADLPPRPA